MGLQHDRASVLLVAPSALMFPRFYPSSSLLDYNCLLLFRDYERHFLLFNNFNMLKYLSVPQNDYRRGRREK